MHIQISLLYIEMEIQASHTSMQDQNQQLRSPTQQSPSPLSNILQRQRNSHDNKLIHYEFNGFKIFLLGFFIALIVVTSYRCFQLKRKEFHIQDQSKTNQKHLEQSYGIIQLEDINRKTDEFQINQQKAVKQKIPEKLIGQRTVQVESSQKQNKESSFKGKEKKPQKMISQQKAAQTIKDIAQQQQSTARAQPSASQSQASIGSQKLSQQTISQSMPNQQTIHSTKVYTIQQQNDPIIHVRRKIQTLFQMKFQQTIYIKKKTNITERQYYNAIDRKDIWKYFNVRNNAFQLLNQEVYTRYDRDSLGENQNLQKAKRIAQMEKQEYQEKYRISNYDELSFCIIVPSYKIVDKFFRNLNSILQQDYSNYHIIFIDDASKDGTADVVRNYIRKYDVPEQKLKFFENQVNIRALPNIDFAARTYCKSGQIMAIIDGDDYLIGRQVFKLINARYQSQNLLALYTNHIRVHEPLYTKVGTCIDYPQQVKAHRSFRSYSLFPASHLRTFYVNLYWRINKRDLKDSSGNYFQAANDFAIMMPILEMASHRYEYLPELTYVYDSGTGENNFGTKALIQARNFRTTKRRHKYQQLHGTQVFERQTSPKMITDKSNDHQ